MHAKSIKKIIDQDKKKGNNRRLYNDLNKHQISFLVDILNANKKTGFFGSIYKLKLNKWLG